MGLRITSVGLGMTCLGNPRTNARSGGNFGIFAFGNLSIVHIACYATNRRAFHAGFLRGEIAAARR